MGIFASITALLLLWHSSYCPASICAAAAAAAATAGEGPSCTAPRPTSDALRPFCFIPRSTISTEAQKVLQERRVLPGGSLRDAPRDKVLAFQAEYNARTAPVSEAARRQHLQVCVCVWGRGGLRRATPQQGAVSPPHPSLHSNQPCHTHIHSKGSSTALLKQLRHTCMRVCCLCSLTAALHHRMCPAQ